MPNRHARWKRYRRSWAQEGTNYTVSNMGGSSPSRMPVPAALRLALSKALSLLQNSLWLVDREGKSWFINASSWYPDTTQNWITMALHFPFKVVQNDYGMETPPGGKNVKQYIHCCVVSGMWFLLSRGIRSADAWLETRKRMHII